MRKPERELLAQEKKRLKKQGKSDRPKKPSTGGFTIWGRIVGIVGPLLLIGLVAATFFTPLLAIENVQVTGIERLNQKKVEKALEALVDKPLTAVSEAEVGALLSEFGLVETFALQAEPPHTLTIKIRERQPILILAAGSKNFLYDAAGVKIAEAQASDDFPYLKLAGDPTQDERYKVAVEVLLSLPVANYHQIFSIEVSRQLTTNLVLRDSDIKVIWGDAKDALLKAEVLDSLIATGQKKGVTIDVSSPNSPVVTYPNY